MQLYKISTPIYVNELEKSLLFYEELFKRRKNWTLQLKASLVIGGKLSSIVYYFTYNIDQKELLNDDMY
ncbi:MULTISPECIES: hypothetical protein [Bacillus]|uniref:Uncharacterized protein n=2 Tax=Bacillus TaxID=1386 RepID=A0A0M4G097_9BACI|nr:MULTISPECIES: hypothetical protein [Bacillus]ALC83425.1 hypothetical protein AM592_19155 [Bacillus gobiensis]MBP1082362.1 hypothetical protein [Bacillus capparidis]MED1097379.1 hypothetical protein [Bacillus capparidis]